MCVMMFTTMFTIATEGARLIRAATAGARARASFGGAREEVLYTNMYLYI